MLAPCVCDDYGVGPVAWTERGPTERLDGVEKLRRIEVGKPEGRTPVSRQPSFGGGVRPSAEKAPGCCLPPTSRGTS